jgi:type I protein arginine methyltransferase
MLDSVIYARDMYLKPGGIIMPNRCTINFAAYGDENGHDGYIKFWNNVYGFDFSCMKKDVLKEAVIEVVREEFVMTKSNIVLNVDLMTATTNCPNFTYDFSLEVQKSGKITSFIGYFDTFFDLPNPVSFSTSPDSPATHWKQILFYLDEPRECKVGDIISGKFVCKRDRKDIRSLIITIDVFGEVLKYCLN